ncbi:MAG: NHLP bacteriocin system secretion protein [Cyanobacteria bacterium P01_A01_bin.84]
MNTSSKKKVKKQLFRKESLERLSSPERLDQLMRVVDPKSWIPLAALGSVGIIALIWSIFGRIPIYIDGVGVILYPSTVIPIQSKNSGQLVDLKVKEGDIVKKGDILATVDKIELREKLKLAQVKLKQLEIQARNASLLQVKRSQQEIEAIKEQRQALEERLNIIQDLTPLFRQKGVLSIRSERQTLQKRLQILQKLIPTFKKRFNNRQMLFKEGAIPEDVLLDSRQDYQNNFASIDEAKSQLKQLDVKETETQQQYLSNLNEVKNIKSQLQELDSKKATIAQQDLEAVTNRKKEIQQVQLEITGLQQQINNNSKIISQYSGRILEITVNRGEVIPAGTRIANIDTKNSPNKLVGMTYFPIKTGKKIQSGMQVQVTPKTVKRERFGGIVGTVTNISTFPITTEAAANVLGNPQILAGIIPVTQKGGLIEVSVNLQADKQNFSGYKWSSSKGPNMEISTGTTTSVRVKIEERAPITFIFPILRSVSGIY